MKMQRHWGLLFIVLLFVAWLAPMQMVIAEQEKPDKMKQKGLILLDFPSPLKAKVEVNLNTKLINLVTKSVSNQPEVAELIQMLDGIYVRTYDRAAWEKNAYNYFRDKFKEDKWEVLIKIQENREVIEINLLFDENKVYGIFIAVIPEASQDVTFVNIVGEIAPERVEDLRCWIVSLAAEVRQNIHREPVFCRFPFLSPNTHKTTSKKFSIFIFFFPKCKIFSQNFVFNNRGCKLPHIV